MSVDEIARELAARLAVGPGEHIPFLASLWADDVEVLHDPAMPTDGVFPGAEIDRRERAAFERMRAAFPDLRHAAVEVEVLGDVVRVGYDLVATFPDGEARTARVGLRLTVRDGRIPGYLGETDLDAIWPFATVAEPQHEWKRSP